MRCCLLTELHSALHVSKDGSGLVRGRVGWRDRKRSTRRPTARPQQSEDQDRNSLLQSKAMVICDPQFKNFENEFLLPLGNDPK